MQFFEGIYCVYGLIRLCVYMYFENKLSIFTEILNDLL